MSRTDFIFYPRSMNINMVKALIFPELFPQILKRHSSLDVLLDQFFSFLVSIPSYGRIVSVTSTV